MANMILNDLVRFPYFGRVVDPRFSINLMRWVVILSDPSTHDDSSPSLAQYLSSLVSRRRSVPYNGCRIARTMEFIKRYLRTLAKYLCLTVGIALAACTHPDGMKSANPPPASGAQLALQVCSACHGLSGNSVSAQIPKLAGQQLQYLVIQLSQFQEHWRASDRMNFVWPWSQLSTAQIQELATYYALQVPMVGMPAYSPLLTSGKTRYQQGSASFGAVACASCHGQSAMGQHAIPRLAGQHSAYLAAQLAALQNPNYRPNADTKFLRSHQLSETEIEAVSLYLGSDAITQDQYCTTSQSSSISILYLSYACSVHY